MNDQHTQIKGLADAIARLIEFAPATKDELHQWYVQAQSLKDDFLFGHGGLSQFVPYFLWQYLSDADIRMKDAESPKCKVGTLIICFSI